MIRYSALILAAAIVPALAADKVREGKWEYMSEMKMPGMPEMPANMPKMPDGMQLPPGMTMPQFGPRGITSTFQRCITNEDLVPKDDKGKEQCTVTKMDRKGNTVNWAASCQTPQGPAKSEGTATYTGDAMEATMRVTGNAEGRPFEMTQNMKGRYLGPCT